MECHHSFVQNPSSCSSSKCRRKFVWIALLATSPPTEQKSEITPDYFHHNSFKFLTFMTWQFSIVTMNELTLPIFLNLYKNVIFLLFVLVPHNSHRDSSENSDMQLLLNEILRSDKKLLSHLTKSVCSVRLKLLWIWMYVLNR